MFMCYVRGGVGHVKQHLSPGCETLDDATSDGPELSDVDNVMPTTDTQQSFDPISAVMPEVEGGEDAEDATANLSDMESDCSDSSGTNSDLDSGLDSDLGPEDGENSYNFLDDDNNL
jgi:hypothetical protein